MLDSSHLHEGNDMDIYCIRCGEPWDIDTVLHDDPEGFKRRGGVIKSCPACENKPVSLSKEQREKLAIIREMAVMFGDDLDGLAAEIEDLGL